MKKVCFGWKKLDFDKGIRRLVVLLRREKHITMNIQRILVACAIMGSAFVEMEAQSLLPRPRSIEMMKGSYDLQTPYRLLDESGVQVPAALREIFSSPSSVSVAKSVKPYVVFRKMNGAVSSPEAYRLNICKDSVVVSAPSAVGFLRAAQTLAQLRTNHKLPCCVVEDAPAFSWRGAMLDVSRHFFPVSYLKRQIDALASYKLNRLHLHLTDAAGWRMEIKRYPRLTNFAAWRTDSLWKSWWQGGRRYVAEGTPGAYGGYYTQQELRELVRYAEERGITIVPEIEMPAHSEEVLAAYPEFSCTHEPYKQADFCPGNIGVYDFLENVLLEVMDVFPSEYIHVGGDEAARASWSACPLCRRLMQELGTDKTEDLQTYLIRHMGKFLRSHGRRLVGWDEIIDEGLAQGSTVMVWRDKELARKAIAHDCDVILSPGKFCYFDGYQDAPPSQPEAMGAYLPLERVYSYAPLQGLTPEECRRVKGVQGNLWAEYIPTEQHAEHMLYPRILAIAEMGWNGTEQKNYADFRQRAMHETDRLRAKGIMAFDLRREQGNRSEYFRPARHKALGASVKYLLPYNSHYCGAGEATLTDGLRGGWDFGDGRWQGFIRGKRFDVVVDLGTCQKISRVHCNIMQTCGPEIFFPARFVVSVSDDGENFRVVHEEASPVARTASPEVRKWGWQGRERARYIRLQAEPGEFGGWIFVDEVEVY